MKEEQATSPPTAADLGSLIRENAEQSYKLSLRMMTWGHLRDVLQGESPPPILHIQLPGAGPDGQPMLIERDLLGMDADTLSQVLLPLVNMEGEAVIEGCRKQAALVHRLNSVCDALVAAHPPPEETPSPTEYRKGRAQRTQQGAHDPSH
jgi:hypothetical protein